ncbi:MAG: hypothetical protein OSJ64_08090, partial [Firmicutes bacterium]|nr:hypothetical protein [Bacillota bacterium]
VSSMPVAANATMTYPVEITIDNPDHTIMAGMFAEVNVVREQSAAENLIIPKTAVSNDGMVYVVDAQNIAHQRSVETGLSDDNNVEILSGLNEGDLVVIVGGYLLSEGAEVRIVTNDVGGDGAIDSDNADNADNDENAANDGDNNDGANADATKAN